MRTIDQLRQALSDPKQVAEYGFSLAQELCCFVNGSEVEADAHELILRALEHREHFGPASVIVDALAREVGLFPYLDPNTLSIADLLAYEYHRPAGLPEDIVLHRPQAIVYRALLSGESVILSAPTSFGKSLVVDAILASGKYRNVVVVVPTLALIDETRRRLVERFRDRYKVITHRSQVPAARNIYVLTQERVLETDRFQSVDLFVIDEFYKLDPQNDEDDRAFLLNQAFYRLNRMAEQFYMLGPYIQSVHPTFFTRVNCRFIAENYTTVVSEIFTRSRGDDEFDSLIDLCRELTEPTIIYCRVPGRAAAVAQHLIEAGLGGGGDAAAADWVGEHYHPEWHFGIALRQGIGIHHGRVPRSLAQYVVRLFNDGELRFLVCTSTLIEGVNTRAKNIVVFDNQVNRTPLDLFTFNNIRGRSGRMMHHFVGRVYVFHDPPESGDRQVNVPVVTQTADAPESLLIQIEEEDLTATSRTRLEPFQQQQVIGYETLRANVGVDLNHQITLATHVRDNWRTLHPLLNWTRTPTYDQLKAVCELMWTHFGGSALAAGSVRSHSQLAFLVWRLRNSPTARQLVELMGGRPEDNTTPDDAVTRSQDFLRLWANFHFPRLLRALDRIQRDVFSRLRPPRAAGNYEFFAAAVENYFLDPTLIALEEYGLPLEIARKMQDELLPDGDLDGVLARLVELDPDTLDLTEFERMLLRQTQASL